MDGSRGDEICVLGPLVVVSGGRTVALQALKQRQLLAALLAGAGTVRSRDALVDALWGASPPPSAEKLLQVYVSKLRRVLPASAQIRTQGSGYAVDLADGALDAARFERLLDEGSAAARAENPALAASLFRRALALWRGDAYGEFADEPFARPEAARLEELRAVAVEERVAAELELGRHVEVLAELRGLAHEQPLRERLQAQLMLALYRCGRQSEALDVYGSTRRVLRDELGLEPGAELRELQQRVLRHDPALARERGTSGTSSALPAPPTPLVGRERELAALVELLTSREVRLLVLTGAGGSGKTRLAVAAARACAGSFANGAAFVGLAALTDPDLLAGAISSALGVDPAAGEPLDTLAAALAPQELLLVLDNVEQLRDGTAVFAELVSRAPRLTLLVTSRVVLHLSGEQVWPVEPLAPRAAVELFLARAREADARFQATSPNERAIERICERLDGLPLAIELAAGRSRSRTPEELLRGLEQRLPLLVGGPRDLPARQQTLRATLEWSVDLLDREEQRDLARLSVFAGGCTLEAAEAVCETTLDRLSSLVDHNLLLRTVGEHGSRYSMLETIRELAAEQLAARGEAEELRRRHAEHMLAIAETLALSVDSLESGVRQRHDIALAEQGNVRAALGWSLDAEPKLCAELALAVEQFLASTNPSEGKHWFGEILRHAEELPLELRARLLRDIGGSTELSGELEGALAWYRESLELYEQLGEEFGILHLRFRQAQVFVRQGDVAGARELAQGTLQRAKLAGLASVEADNLHVLALVAYREGNLEEAFELQHRSLLIYRRLGGWPWGESVKLGNLSTFASHLGRPDEGEAYGREALTVSREIGSRLRTLTSLAALSLAARAAGDVERAGRLWGAIEAEEERSFHGGWVHRRHDYERHVLTPRGPQLERGLALGRRMTLDEASAYALGEGAAGR